jgi:tetratricopeptide (TPR) repeat protein
VIPGTDPGPARTLAVLLGAGWFQHAPRLAQGAAFEASGRDFRDYLLAQEGLGLPRENVSWLFDDSRSAADQLTALGDFLERRCLELKAGGTPAADLIVYYVGHGLFCGPERTYHFAIRATDERREGVTSLRVGELAQTLNDRARFLRKFLLLDCCFSGAAYKEFQSGPLQLGRQQILSELPSRGTALLCAASARDAALAPAGLQHTMFSHSLLRSLRQGHPSLGRRMSLNELGELIKQDLRESFPQDWVRPEVHSPDQREGEVAGVGLFPNPAYEADADTGAGERTGPHGAPAESEPTLIVKPSASDQAALAQMAVARLKRGILRGEQCDRRGALADYTEVIQLAGAPPALVAQALVNRGTLRGQQGDQGAAIADYVAVLQLPGAPADRLGKALVSRGTVRGLQGDTQGELADYTAVIQLHGALAEQVATALVNRGITRGQMRDDKGEAADYTAAITLPGAPPEQVAKALYYRGITRAQKKDRGGAIADYTAVIELPGAPADWVAKARTSRQQMLDGL